MTTQLTRHRLPLTTLALIIVGVLAFAAGRLIPAGGSEVLASPIQEEILDQAVMPTNPNVPGKKHEVLDVLIGTWDATFKLWGEPGMSPETSQGTVTREWVLDGRYVKETVEAETPFGLFRGIGYLGYNNVDGVYELVWMDNQATAISVERGTFNTARRVMTTRGEHRDPGSGNVINTWGTMDLSSPNRHVYTGYTITENGEEMRVYEGVLQKK